MEQKLLLSYEMFKLFYDVFVSCNLMDVFFTVIGWFRNLKKYVSIMQLHVEVQVIVSETFF